jgi:hypothetical protein
MTANVNVSDLLNILSSCHSSNLSFKNCMLRIPGSHNLECVKMLREITIVWILRPFYFLLFFSKFPSIFSCYLCYRGDETVREISTHMYIGKTENNFPPKRNHTVKVLSGLCMRPANSLDIITVIHSEFQLLSFLMLVPK